MLLVYQKPHYPFASDPKLRQWIQGWTPLAEAELYANSKLLEPSLPSTKATSTRFGRRAVFKPSK